MTVECVRPRLKTAGARTNNYNIETRHTPYFIPLSAPIRGGKRDIIYYSELFKFHIKIQRVRRGRRAKFFVNGFP